MVLKLSSIFVLKFCKDAVWKEFLLLLKSVCVPAVSPSLRNSESPEFWNRSLCSPWWPHFAVQTVPLGVCKEMPNGFYGRTWVPSVFIVVVWLQKEYSPLGTKHYSLYWITSHCILFSFGFRADMQLPTWLALSTACAPSAYRFPCIWLENDILEQCLYVA